MSEKIPKLNDEVTRESGLVVPGEYTEGNNPTRPEIILPTEQEVRLYNKSRNETKEEKAEIADHQAYEEIIKPINVLHLKEAIDHAQDKLGTRSANVNSGRNLSKEANAIREEYIAEYLQTGNKRDLPRPIPHEIRTQLEDLLKMSYRQLETLLGESEENQENIQPDDESENSTKNEPKPYNGPENSSENQGSEKEQAQEEKGESDSESDDNSENELDGEDDLEDEPTKKYEIDENTRKAIIAEAEDKTNLLEQIDTADNLSGRDRTHRLGDIARKASAKPDILLENDQLAIDNMPTYKDIAIMAAVRIRKSKAGNPMTRAARFLRKGAASDFYLHEVATNGSGSVEAAENMRRGRYFGLPNVNKGRNDAMQKAANIQSSREALESMGSGLAFPNTWKARNEGIVSLAEKTGDPSLETSINGLYDFIERGKTRAALAVSVAKKGDIPAGIRIAKGIKWPNAKKKALDEIAQL